MKTLSKNQVSDMRVEDSGYNPLADLFGNNFMSCDSDNPVTIPFIHIKEKKNIYKLQVDLPGFHKKDFNVYVEGNMLVISCKKGLQMPPENYAAAFSRRECNYAYFSRFLSLPDNVDSDRIRAKYDGVLNLSIPKKQTNKKTGKQKPNN